MPFDTRLMLYDIQRGLQKKLRDDLPILRSRITLAGMNASRESVEQLWKEKARIESDLLILGKNTANMRFYCVWDLLSEKR